ncbi:alpha/beta fold hydrolase [Salinifilum ghardaiensis]
MTRWDAHGRGEPVTLVVHGLGATPGEARIPASGLRGTRIVVTLPGHGAAPDPAPDYWNYENVAHDVLRAADEVGADRAVGVSLGAGALTRIAADKPERFTRLALIQPAALDSPHHPERSRVFGELTAAVERAGEDDGAALREDIRASLPEGVDAGEYVEQRAAALRRLEPALRVLPEQAPLSDAGALAAVASEVLVVAAAGDPMHPESVARDVARAFPRGTCAQLPSRAPMTTHRAQLRGLLRDFLAP